MCINPQDGWDTAYIKRDKVIYGTYSIIDS